MYLQSCKTLTKYITSGVKKMDPVSMILIFIAIGFLAIAIVCLVRSNPNKEQNNEKPCSCSCPSLDEEVPIGEPVFMTKEEAVAYVRQKDAEAKEQQDQWVADVKAIIAEAFAEHKKVDGLTPEQIETARIILANREKDVKAQKEATVALINEILKKIHDQPYEKLFAKILADIKAAKSKADFDAAVKRFEDAVEEISCE